MTRRAAIVLAAASAMLPACERCAGSDEATVGTAAPAPPPVVAIDLPTPLFQAHEPVDRPSGVAVSADGRAVVFSSGGRVTADDSDADDDVFVYDPSTRAITRVSTGGSGPAYLEERGVSADGQRILFVTSEPFVEDDRNGEVDLYLIDRTARSVTRVSLGPDGRELDGDADRGAISADGQVVAFSTRVAGLVRGDRDDANDVFVRDLATGAIARASIGPNGHAAEGTTFGALGLSRDGSAVAFFTSHLVPHEPLADSFSGELDVFERGSDAARFGADLAQLSVTSMTDDARTAVGVHDQTEGMRVDLESGARTPIEGLRAVETLAISPDGHVIAVVDWRTEGEPVRSLRVLRDGAETFSRPLAAGVADGRERWRSFAVANDGTVVAHVHHRRADGDGWSFRTCVAVLAPTPIALACSAPSDHEDL